VRFAPAGLTGMQEAGKKIEMEPDLSANRAGQYRLSGKIADETATQIIAIK
jgi:hypothetical protein